MDNIHKPISAGNNDNPAILSYNMLRQTIGWLGILLPLLIYLVVVVTDNCDHLQESISHYYYTRANSWFVGILWGLGLVLLFYPSYPDQPKRDGILTSIAGIGAILVPLFPTNVSHINSCGFFILPDSTIRNGIHYAGAGLLLILFSYISIRIFTRTRPGNDLSTFENRFKRRRNHLYITCGWITLASVVSIGVMAIIENQFPEVKLPYTLTYWLEVCALVPFGISWLIKGGFALTDEDETSTLSKARNMLRHSRS